MRSIQLPTLLLAVASLASAASWGFSDATVAVSGKASSSSKLSPDRPLASKLPLEAGDKLKLQLTSTEGSKAKRAHQVFLTLATSTNGLSESWPFDMKPDGKAKIELATKDIPIQLIAQSRELQGSLTIGGFGSSDPYKKHLFDIEVQPDPAKPFQAPESPVRYGQLPEIHHIFREDPKNPPKIITLVFTVAVLGTVPMLLGVWGALGANLNHLPQAISAAPLSHGLFYGSIVALEGIFFLYYTSWKLYQVLPAVAAVGSLAFVTGSRALSEVQQRRLSGLR